MAKVFEIVRTRVNPRRGKTLFPSPENWPRKSRSRIPRISRRNFLPPFYCGGMFEEKVEYGCEEEISALQADSSSSSCFLSVITAESSLVSSRSQCTKKRQTEGTPRSEFIGVDTGDEFRRITRIYARRIKNQKLDEEKEAKSSGIGFFSVAGEEGRNMKCRFNHNVQVDIVEDESTRRAGSVRSISESSHVSGGFSDANFTKKVKLNRESEGVLEVSNSKSLSIELNCKTEDHQITKSVQTSQYTEGDGGGSSIQLACSEQLSSDSERSAYSSSNEAVSSEYESGAHGESSEGYYSDLSQLLESSEDFSGKSHHDTSASVAFSLYLEFRKDFWSSTPPDAPSRLKNENNDEFTLLRFENDEDEESYKMFRIREKNIELYEYADEKHDYFTVECCEMVIQERLLMVNWMVEHSNEVQLQKETLFLGVSLMDRFLCRGFFKTQRNLHLLGIACVTLATRLEENQPYNIVRRKSFTVGGNTYDRREVVGMEWLVQEVLSFQCFLPTTYNFLWFYLKAARADSKVEVVAKYLAALSLLDHDRLRFWPSTVAAGLVVLASLATGRDESCQWIMKTHVRTKNDDLAECIKPLTDDVTHLWTFQSLEWLIKHVP